MDTQSRGVRLPASGRRKSNAYPNCKSYRHSDANGYCNSYRHCGSISNADCHGIGDSNPDTVRQADSDSETSSDYTPAPVVL